MNYVLPPNRQLYFEQIWAQAREIPHGRVAQGKINLDEYQWRGPGPADILLGEAGTQDECNDVGSDTRFGGCEQINGE